MKWFAFLLLALMLSSGCKRKASPTTPAASGSPQVSPSQPETPSVGQPSAGNAQAKKRMSREEGERKYHRFRETMPVKTPLADVVKHFGQEPERWEGSGADRRAIWVLEDGSEFEIEFYNGLSGSGSVTWVNKK